MRTILFLILIFLLISCKKAQVLPYNGEVTNIPWADTSRNHPKNDAFLALLKKYQKKGLPGISLLVRDRYGCWVGATGKADIGKDKNFQPGTISKAASITKLLVGTMVFRLMEDSAISGVGFAMLDRKISEILPSSVTGHLPNGHLITLGQCMKHETGIPDVIEQDAFYLAVLNQPNHKWKPEELLQFIYDKQPLFHPSDTAIYSNTNTILVTMAIELLTNQPHDQLLKKYVFQPLGMNDTYYQWHDILPENVAQGYFDLYNNNTIVNVSNLVTGSGNGYGGVYSNLFDLYKFGNALLWNKTLLQPSSLNRMMQTGKTDGNNRYGYGIQQSYLDLGSDFGWGHKGRDLGYTANLFYFPAKGVLQIYFVNYGTDSKSNLRQVFYEFQDELLRISLQ